MSIRYALSEFYDETLDRSQDFGYQVANQARRAICSVWSQTPGALIPNPGDSFRRGAVSALCQDFPPPLPPSIPFTGGQCPGVTYSFAFGVGFTVRSTGVVVPPSNPGVRSATVIGPVRPVGGQEGNNYVWRNATDNVLLGSVNVQSNRNPTYQIYDMISIPGGQVNTCGNPDPEYPGGDYIDDRDTIIEGDTIVEGDENNPITIDISPTFGDESCVGAFVFCVDVEGNRVTLDAGGVTINLPGTGGGDGGSDGGGDSETITNIDNRTTIIQNQQEECCAAIIQSISSFRNRATELFNESELRDACIVGLIRNAAPKYPKFEDPISERASGFSGFNGVVRFVQPLRADSCFLIVNIEPTETFRGRLYALREESADVEGGFGHVEVSLFDGGIRPASEAGIRVLSATRTLITFPYITSGNQIRLSLKGGLNYSVVDPGFRWRPLELPQCDEIVDPTP